jgi:hypothetical protein
MTQDQLAKTALHYIWSSLHFPNEPNHAGKKIMDLFRNTPMSTIAKNLFNDLEQNHNFSSASSVLNEINNLLSGNVALQKDVRDAISRGTNDSKIPMPPVQSYQAVSNTYEPTSGGTSIWAIIGGILIVIRLLLLLTRL